MARLCMSYLWDDEKQAYLAIATNGHPQAGDTEVMVLTVALLPTPRACREWFKRMRKERPWEIRH